MTTAEQEGRVARVRFATRDRDAATEFINKAYTQHRPWFPDNSHTTELSATMASIQGLRCDRLRHSMHVHAGLEPMDHLLVGQIIRGRLRVRCGADEALGRAGDSLLYLPGAPLRVEWEDFDVVGLRLSLDRVSALAAELTGLDPAHLRFESMVPVSEAMNRHWRSVASWVHRELGSEHSTLVHPLVADQMLRMVVASVLSVFPNSSMTSEVRGAGRTTPAALRRAVAFIDSNAHRPIGLAEIADAARIGPRALQQSFARRYQTSPVGYLRRVRLERAHCELQAADPTSGVTVAAIAARWGYATPGRFAADYRKAFGQLPSHTLLT